MQAITAKVSTKYQVVIPKEIREPLNIQPHDELLFLLDGDAIVIRPKPVNFTQAIRGLYQELWPDPDEWLESERSAWEK